MEAQVFHFKSSALSSEHGGMRTPHSTPPTPGRFCMNPGTREHVHDLSKVSHQNSPSPTLLELTWSLCSSPCFSLKLLFLAFHYTYLEICTLYDSTPSRSHLPIAHLINDDSVGISFPLRILQCASVYLAFLPYFSFCLLILLFL